jgi:hypothetical protein
MGPGQATCLAVIILVGLGLFCTSAGLFWFTGGDVPFNYGITIDAGSSKTAFYLYDWSATKLNDTGLVKQLDVEYVRAGIDDYGEDTKELIPKLIHTLSRVTRKIDYRNKNYVIPIYLGKSRLASCPFVALGQRWRAIKKRFGLITNYFHNFCRSIPS